ncbi:MAG: SUF system NifU family Fe-S cluster assembly protein [Candidatus Magasanikbacteria bacterium]|nr:SUF system NifU family Fe-S cluster assembly protein [Candidatus Magasanikbacteria bacterium]
MSLMQMYKENILYLYKNPLNKKDLADFDICEEGLNPMCGDEVKIKIKFENDKVFDVGFLGDGCAISQAATSLITDFIKGKTKEEISKITDEDVLEMLNIEISHMRMKCAMLGKNTIQKIIK